MNGHESNRERRGGIERQGVEMRFYVLFLPKISPFFWFSHSYRVLATAVPYRCKREENRGQSHHAPEAPDPVSSNQVNFVGWHVETWPMVVRCSLWIGNPMSVFWKKIPQFTLPRKSHVKILSLMPLILMQTYITEDNENITWSWSPFSSCDHWPFVLFLLCIPFLMGFRVWTLYIYSKDRRLK
jgi:hypothetical protein